jgi:hypothetical protein
MATLPAPTAAVVNLIVMVDNRVNVSSRRGKAMRPFAEDPFRAREPWTERLEKVEIFGLGGQAARDLR